MPIDQNISIIISTLVILCALIFILIKILNSISKQVTEERDVKIRFSLSDEDQKKIANIIKRSIEDNITAVSEKLPNVQALETCIERTIEKNFEDFKTNNFFNAFRSDISNYSDSNFESRNNVKSDNSQFETNNLPHSSSKIYVRSKEENGQIFFEKDESMTPYKLLELPEGIIVEINSQISIPYTETNLKKVFDIHGSNGSIYRTETPAKCSKTKDITKWKLETKGTIIRIQ